jgi:hypothetical protein
VGRWRLAVLCLALISLIKVTALLFLPVYLAHLFFSSGRGNRPQRIYAGGSTLAQALGIFALSWVVFYAPFWRGSVTVTALLVNPGANQYIHSLGTIIRHRLPESLVVQAGANGWRLPEGWTLEAMGAALDTPTRWVLLAITALVILIAAWRARSFAAVLGGWGWSVFAYLAVGSTWTWPWYIAWLIVPAALAGPGRLLASSLIMSLTGLSLYAFAPHMAQPFAYLPGWTGLVVMGPPLLYAIASYIVDRITSPTMTPGAPARSDIAVRADSLRIPAPTNTPDSWYPGSPPYRE